MNNKILDRMLECYESSEEECNAELNALLEKHSEERKAFIRLMMDEEIFKEEFKLEHVEEVFSPVSSRQPKEGISKVESGSEFLSETKPFKHPVHWLGPTIAAVAATVMIMLVIDSMTTQSLPKQVDRSVEQGSNTVFSGSREPKGEPKNVPKETKCALLVNVSPAAEWGQARSPGSELNPGLYELKQGAASIEFSNGVQMTVDGPAEFEIRSSMEVHLSKGKVRANVPPEGHGFMVYTPEVKIKDLGTEFGVAVGEDQATQIHVFNGEIELYESEAKPPILAQQGYAAKWVKGKEEAKISVDEKYFSTRDSISYKRWSRHREKVLKDPKLLAFYDFSGNDETLRNIVSEEHQGWISSPIRVRGRWPNSNALLFDRRDHWAEFTLPAVEGDFSLQTWICPDRLETSITSIINTKRYEVNDLHLQLGRRGGLHVGLATDVKKNVISAPMVKVNEWTQLTLTYDASKQLFSCYVNGKRYKSVNRRIDRMDFGEMLLGCWVQDGKRGRGLRGRIDEMSLRARCLSPSEVQRDYKLGAPQ